MIRPFRFHALAAALCLSFAFPGGAHAAAKPNVLFIAVDDMNDWIGCLETTPRALTPNIDRLAARGVNFTNAHTAGVFCAPSRAAVFSGQFASTTGCYTTANYFYHHPEIRPLQVSFAEGGYEAFGAGAKTDATVSLIDMYPTLVELCGLPQPDQELEGESIAATLADPAGAVDRTVFLPYLEPGAYAVINRDWRYIRYADDTEELYAVQTDPNEWDNIASNPEFENVKTRLRKNAPETFAEPAFKLNLRKHLILEGESFRWEVK